MPLDTIYLTRHGHRLSWTIDYQTGTYKSQFPTPSGNPSDPTLTSHGVRQASELAVHILSADINPKPFRVYSSPFWRCLQTIEPTVRGLNNAKSNGDVPGIDDNAEFEVRIENGLGEWFGSTTFFHHPTPPTLDSLLQTKTTPTTTTPFTLNRSRRNPILYTSTRGESIPQLHNRLATTLSALIAEVDAEIDKLESSLPAEQRSSKAILICSHAAPLIALGRVLTGHMPEDSGEEDFYVYTAGLSTFRRRSGASGVIGREGKKAEKALAPGTKITNRAGIVIPEWEGARGVGGGWDCVLNGDCSFLSSGAERGWHFSGEESFDTGPMAEMATSAEGELKVGTKL
ncbi:histidine phosphatase superfamily [Aspergillus karnatakaensis]|uniref:phosphoglycerate mutase family protein n=1 Tax=Aspergillus karnatakaensis TaxID=1810916 RepID=UPI003CCD3BD2